MSDFSEILAILVVILGLVWFGGWAHEKDLLRHCVDEQTMHAWTTDKEIYCEVRS